MIRKLLITTFITTFFGGLLISNPVLADKKPKIDRAVLKTLTAELLLPDGRPLFVGMSLDCDSRFEHAGMLIFSDQGVTLLMQSFRSLYGERAAEEIRRLWMTKQQPQDPRKPSYLIVLDDKSMSDADSIAMIPPIEQPVVIASCGTIEHFF